MTSGSWLAISISIMVAFISAFTAFINHEKLRLDLYNRRFSVYADILKYALEFYYSKDHGTLKQINRYSSELKKKAMLATRESRFLFKKEDPIHHDMEEVIRICEAIARIDDPDPDNIKQEIKRLSLLLEQCLLKLEEAMYPYLRFDRSWKKPSTKNADSAN